MIIRLTQVLCYVLFIIMYVILILPTLISMPIIYVLFNYNLFDHIDYIMNEALDKIESLNKE